MIGGLSNVKPSDEEIEVIVSQIKDNFEEINYQTDKFKSDSYKSQVVNGVNYFVKIETDREYVHLRIHKSLPHNDSVVSLHSHQNNKSKEDEITYF